MSHGSAQDATQGAYEDALRAGVFAALAGHPADSASLEEERNDSQADIWSLTIHPARVGAATASVTFAGGDEVVLGFGETHAYMWDDDPNSLAEEVRQVLTAVFAGHFEEVGMRNDARVRVMLDDGRVWRGGSMGLPVTWTLRRVRKYLPLSGE